MSSSLQSIPSLRLLAFIVPEKSLTKQLTLTYMEKKKNERTNEQISRESPFSLTQCKSSLLHWIPRLRLLDWPIWGKKNERTDEQISREGPLSLTRYKSWLLHCIPSFRLLAFIVPEKSLTKNLTYLAHVYLEFYYINKKGTSQPVT